MAFSAVNKHLRYTIFSREIKPLLKDALLSRVEAGDVKNAKSILDKYPDMLINKRFIREESLFFIAAWDRNKDMWNMLAEKWLATQPKEKYEQLKQLLEFQYLVIGGQRDKAEEFLKDLDIETKERLIFGKGPEGFSAIETSVIELDDVEMRLRLYRQLTNNSKSDNPNADNTEVGNAVELAELYKKIYQDEKSSDKEKWETYLEALMEKLPEEYKQQAQEQISGIKNDDNLAKQAKSFIQAYKDAYQKCVDLDNNRMWGEGEEAWFDIGKLMRKLARHILWEYFRPKCPFYNVNNPDTCLRTGYEAEPEKLEFKFNGGENLFTGIYNKLGRAFSVFRGWLTGAWRCGAREWRLYVSSSRELAAVSSIFEANEQKSRKELEALNPRSKLLLPKSPSCPNLFRPSSIIEDLPQVLPRCNSLNDLAM